MKKITLFINVLLLFVISIKAQNPPTINCPSDIEVGNDAGQCSAIVTFEDATAYDTEDGDLSTTQTQGLPSGSEFPVGETLIEFSATDSDDNTVVCQFTVRVNDVEYPIITCKEGVVTIELDQNGQHHITLEDMTDIATDNCGIVASLITVDEVDCPDIGESIPVTTIVADASGNTVGCTTDIQVVDNMPPVLTCPSDYIVCCNYEGFYVIPDYFDTYEAMAIDNCTEDTEIILTQEPVPGSEFGITVDTNNDPVLVSFTATDALGNTAYCEFELGIKECFCSVDKKNLVSNVVKLHPNPATNQIYIQTTLDKIRLQKAYLYDLKGKLLHQYNLDSMLQIQEIDISAIQRGFYILVLETGEGIRISKSLLVE